jgi:hypothetical protein
MDKKEIIKRIIEVQKMTEGDILLDNASALIEKIGDYLQYLVCDIEDQMIEKKTKQIIIEVEYKKEDDVNDFISGISNISNHRNVDLLGEITTETIENYGE